MNQPDLSIEDAHKSIAWAEPDCLLFERDRFLYRPCKDLAMGKTVRAVHWIEIGRDRRLVFGYGLRIPMLRPRTWPLALCTAPLRGAAAMACPAKSSARTKSAAAVSVILSMTRLARLPASRHFAS